MQQSRGDALPPPFMASIFSLGTSGKREAKWWGFGAECSEGPFLMLSELPLGLTYASGSQHPEAITSAGGPIKPMLSLQWNNLNCHSHAGITPQGGPEAIKRHMWTAHAKAVCAKADSCVASVKIHIAFLHNNILHFKKHASVCVYTKQRSHEYLKGLNCICIVSITSLNFNLSWHLTCLKGACRFMRTGLLIVTATVPPPQPATKPLCKYCSGTKNPLENTPVNVHFSSRPLSA